MIDVSAVFFVTESEYPKLQAACPIDFPFTYMEFIERVEDGIRQMKESITIEKCYVNVDEFLAWCRETKIEPDNKARAKYALLFHAQSVNLKTSF